MSYYAYEGKNHYYIDCLLTTKTTKGITKTTNFCLLIMS